MRKTLLFVATIAAFMFAACEKDSDEFTFSAVMENPSQNGKTQISADETGGYNVAWESGDWICVSDGSIWQEFCFVRTTSEGVAKFNGTPSGSFDISASSYEAYYPNTLVSDGALSLPSIQNYREGGISGFPMYAKSNSSTGVLEFQNLCGAMRFQVPATSGVTITKVVVEATESLCGTFELADVAGYNQASITSGSNIVTLDCGSGVSVDGGKDFYVIIPAGSYTNLSVKFYDNAAGYYEKNAASATIARNHIYTIPTSLGTRHELPCLLNVSALRSFLENHTDIANVLFKYESSVSSGTKLSSDGSVDIWANYDGTDNRLTISTLSSTISLPTSTSLNGLFSNLENLEYVSFGTGFNSSNLTEMVGVFKDCANLSMVDMYSFTTSQVTDMSDIFQDCVNLFLVALGDDFIISNTCTVSGFFDHAGSNIGYLFLYCPSATANVLTNSSVSGWDGAIHEYEGTYNEM